MMRFSVCCVTRYGCHRDQDRSPVAF